MRIQSLAFVLCCALPAAAAPSFEVIVSNTFVDGRLSADGSIATYAEASSSGASGIYRVATGAVEPLAFGFDGVTTPVASADGSVVIGSTFGSPDREFRSENGTTTFVDGTAVAHGGISADGSAHIANNAFFSGASSLVNSGGSVPLGDLPGGDSFAFGNGLSGDGTIAVGRSSSAAGMEAFRWESGVMTGLGDLTGGAFASEAFDISLDGSTIVGFGTSGAGEEATLWQGGSLQSLGDLPGGLVSSRALGVSGDGSVVVGRAAGAGGSTPFIWTEENGMQDLAVVFASLGIDHTDIALFSAIDVSADGRTILGTGTNVGTGGNQGLRVVWIATIPEPATGALVAMGLVGLAAARRRAR